MSFILRHYSIFNFFTKEPKLIIFKHTSALGNAPAHELFNRIKLTRKEKTKPARDFSDYQLEIDRNKLPEGISIIEKS